MFKRFFLKTLWTKTAWVGIAMVVEGVVRVAHGDVSALSDIGLGLGLITGRDAVTKLQEK